MAPQPRHRDDGASYLELVVLLAVIGTLTGLAVPVTAHAIDAGRARHAAGFAAARLRMARHQAVSRTTTVALIFDNPAGKWTFRVCVDGNGNGLRRAEIAAGVDTCTEGPYDLERMFPGVEVAVDSRLPGPDGTASTADPVKFGSSDVASFAPEGTATAGTLFLRSKHGVQYAVRVAGVTGRTRLLRYDPGARAWLAG